MSLAKRLLKQPIGLRSQSWVNVSYNRQANGNRSLMLFEASKLGRLACLAAGWFHWPKMASCGFLTLGPIWLSWMGNDLPDSLSGMPQEGSYIAVILLIPTVIAS
jgi:hypothetical protein